MKQKIERETLVETPGVKEIHRHFRLTQKEDESLKKLINFAHLTRQIEEPTFTEYIRFCLKVGEEKLHQVYDTEFKN